MRCWRCLCAASLIISRAHGCAGVACSTAYGARYLPGIAGCNEVSQNREHRTQQSSDLPIFPTSTLRTPRRQDRDLPMIVCVVRRLQSLRNCGDGRLQKPSAARHPTIMLLLRVQAAAVAGVVDALSRGMGDQFSDLPLKGFIQLRVKYTTYVSTKVCEPGR